MERDYVSAGLDFKPAFLAFPDLIAGERHLCSWQYFRKSIPHRWFVDRNDPTTGFLNADEASILHSNARLFAGKAALEIGCWRGWSAYQVASAGVATLDIVDPILGSDDIRSQIQRVLANANPHGDIQLVAGFSPGALEPMTGAGKIWDFAFIDGDHDRDAPLNDAIAVERSMSEEAMVLFHDLMSPDVAAGLDHFRSRGWRIRIYDTVQIMGAAWRGSVEPVSHHPDPQENWERPSHLSHY